MYSFFKSQKWKVAHAFKATRFLPLFYLIIRNILYATMQLPSPELLGRGRTVPAIRASGWRNRRPAHPARDAAHFRSAASSPPDSGSSAPNDP